MNRIAALLAGGILMMFIFASCDTTDTYVKGNSQDTAKSGVSADNSAQAAPSTKAEEAKAEETPVQNEEKIDNTTVALIGKYILTREKYKIITEYMNEKYDYTLTPEQEKEFLDFIIKKKLMAMDAREKGYDKRKDIQVKYEWDFDDLLSHAYYVENVENKA